MCISNSLYYLVTDVEEIFPLFCKGTDRLKSHPIYI